MKIYYCFLVFGLFLCLSAFSQTPEEETDARRICVLNAVNISDSASDEEDNILKQYFKENLILELISDGFYIIDEAFRQQKQKEMKYTDEDLIEGSKALALAAAVSADIVIIQFYHIKENRITLGIKCYDVKTQTLAVQNIMDTRYGLNMSTPIYEFIKEMIPLIKEALEEVPEIGEDIVKDTFVEETVTITEVVEKGNIVKLRFISPDDGAEIFLADENMGAISDGQLEIDVQVNSELLFEIRKEGYHLTSRKINIGEDNLECSLKPLMKLSRWGLKVDYTFFQFIGAGLGVRYYFKPDVWGVELLDYPYLQISGVPERNTVLHNDTSLGIFVYPFRLPSSLFRFSIGAGLGGIGTFFLDSGLPVYYDIFSEWGSTVELNYADFLVFLKFYGRYIFAFRDNGVLGTRMVPPIGMPLTLGVVFKW